MTALERPLSRTAHARAALYALLEREGVRTAFPDEVEREVQALLAAPGLDDPALVDLTHLPFVTIDNEGSRDLDQALFIDAGAGGFEVRYALADASYYARPGTALFEEALLRGASYYLPGLMVPMLPEALSTGLVSLNEGAPRRALVFTISLDEQGAVTGTRIERARIESRRKLTYEGVQAFLDDPVGHPLGTEPFAASLLALREVGARRIERAADRDVVQLHRQEVEIQIDGGVGFVLLAGARNDVERYNEQISLLVNTEGARFLLENTGRGALPVFRTHPPPEEQATRKLLRFISLLVEERGLDARFRWVEGESLARYLARLSPKSDEERRALLTLHRQALLLNQRSRFEEEPGPHHGVGADVYARFSSPMREIAGVFTHKECVELLEGHAGALEADRALRERVVERANASRDLQARLTKAANKLALDALFTSELHREQRRAFVGTLVGASRQKLYVLLDDPPVEVKVYLDEDVGMPQGGGASSRTGSVKPRNEVGAGPGRGASEGVGAPQGDSEVEVDADGVRALVGGEALAAGDRVQLMVKGYDEARGRWRFALSR